MQKKYSLLATLSLKRNCLYLRCVYGINKTNFCLIKFLIQIFNYNMQVYKVLSPANT